MQELPVKKVNRVLSLDDRKVIETMLHSKFKHRDICKAVKMHTTTLYREIKRCKEEYNAEEAHASVYRNRSFIDYDIISKRYGLLVVLEYSSIYKRRTWWRCKCDCGKECIMSRKMLAEYCSPKRPLSCGCIAKQAKSGGVSVPLEEASLAKFQDLVRFRKFKRDCWIWVGYRQKGKCPKTSFRSKSMSVRRCMYMLSNGLTELHEKVHTTCGNLYCFNPEHLTLTAPNPRHLYEEDFEECFQ